MRGAERGYRSGGQALVEFALVLPLVLILIMNIVNFAGFFNAFISVGNAARSAGDYTIMGKSAWTGSSSTDGSSLGTFTAPSDNGQTGAALVANMISNDMLSLPNRSSITVRVCEMNPSDGSGTTTCYSCTNGSGTGNMSCASGSGAYTTNPTADTTTGEGPNYIMTWVDVSYTYNPFIPLGFKFPGLGFGLTLPSNLVIHRQSVYRVLD